MDFAGELSRPTLESGLLFKLQLLIPNTLLWIDGGYYKSYKLEVVCYQVPLN